METVEKLYRDPSTGLLGIQNLYRKAKAENKNVTVKMVKDFLNSQYSKQLHKPIRKLRHYFPITASQDNEAVEIDLMDVSTISTKNNNFKWLFVVCDVFSRKRYVYPMKNKTKENVLEAFKKFLGELKLHKAPDFTVFSNKWGLTKIICDHGSEFTSKAFVDLCNEHNIIIDYVSLNNHLIPHVD